MAIEDSVSSELLLLLSQLAETQSDLADCGPAVRKLLSTTDAILNDSQASGAELQRAGSICTSLISLADEKLLSWHYSEVPICWRRLHTDAGLLSVIVKLLEGKEDSAEVDWLATVRQLDMILIVSGAPGEGRKDAVFTLLDLVQDHLSLPSPPTKRARLNPPPLPLDSPHVGHPIPTFSASQAPSFDDYLAGRCKEPFIVEGGCLDWPATEEGKWNSTEYLKGVAGKGRAVPVEVGGNYTARGWGQEIVPFSDFLDSCFSSPDDTRPPLYLAQHSLFRQFPELSSDILVPDYVYSCPPVPKAHPSYTPPSNADEFVMNAWLGPAGTLSPAHTDPYYNCYAQVVGSKWLWVAPPTCSSAMYTYGSDLPDCSSPAVDAEAGTESNTEAEGATSHLLTNTSRIDVSLSPSSPALDRFPRFKKEVEPKAMQAVLKRGDLLVMPPGWWHSMKSLETSFSVSIWY